MMVSDGKRVCTGPHQGLDGLTSCDHLDEPLGLPGVGSRADSGPDHQQRAPLPRPRVLRWRRMAAPQVTASTGRCSAAASWI
jgi:hypothetical protein